MIDHERLRVRSSNRPVHVAAFEFAIGQPSGNIEDLGAFDAVQALVRLHEVPVGYVEAPVTSGRCRGRDLTAQVVAHHANSILRHLLTDSLISGAFVTARTPQRLFAIDHPPNQAAELGITVAVCTRDRPESLARCLTALTQLDYPNVRLLVVDNAPSSDRTERYVRRQHAPVQYVLESRPGLSYARNRAIEEASGDIIAYVDDDSSVDRGWARNIVRIFQDNPDVMAVTGLVAPRELRTDAQQCFEQHGGFGRGFSRRWLRRRADERAASRFANTGTFGTGTNMAFRRSVLEDTGHFDPALGAGTATGGGEDLDMFFRVLKAGHTLVYEPGALVWHHHRTEHAELHTQIESWGAGMMAHLLRNMQVFPDERVGLLQLATRLTLVYYPRRVLQSLVSPSRRASLAQAEFRGALAELSRYPRGRRRLHDEHVDAHRLSSNTARSASLAGRIHRLTIDLSESIPPTLLGSHDADVVAAEIRNGDRPLGSVEIPTGGHTLSRMRVVDAIVSTFWRELFDRHQFADALRTLQAGT